MEPGTWRTAGLMLLSRSFGGELLRRVRAYCTSLNAFGRGWLWTQLGCEVLKGKPDLGHRGQHLLPGGGEISHTVSTLERRTKCLCGICDGHSAAVMNKTDADLALEELQV